MRQTHLSLAKLVSQLTGEEPTFNRRCLLANEVGEIAIGDTAEAEAAQKVLAGLLENPDETPEVLYPAYGYGLQVEQPVSELINALVVFEDDPANAHICEPIREQLHSH